jgi:hypothetical protein
LHSFYASCDTFCGVSPQSWADEQAARTAAEVRRLRNAQGRSAQWVADRTAELGYPISRATIADIENGRRKWLTTTELVVLAWVLKVPPVLLLYPALPDGPVEIVPGVEKPSLEAVLWFSGELAYGHVGDEPRDFQAAKDGPEPVELARERVTTQGQITIWSKMAAAMKDPAVAQSFIDQIESAQARIGEINDRLRQIDGAVVSDGG